MRDGRVFCGPIWAWRPQEGYLVLVSDDTGVGEVRILFQDMESAITKNTYLNANAIGSRDEIERAIQEGWTPPHGWTWTPLPEVLLNELEGHSKAVIAKDSTYNGIVIWYTGRDLEYMIDSFGCMLHEICLDDAPHGISIWEGYYVIIPIRSAGDDTDCDIEPDPKGAFRKPTEEEWVAIRAGKSPWSENDSQPGTFG